MVYKWQSNSDLDKPHPLEWILVGYLLPRRTSCDLTRALENGQNARKRMTRRRVVPHDFVNGRSMLLHTRLRDVNNTSPLMAGLLELCLRDGFAKGISPEPCVFTYTDREGTARQAIPDVLFHFRGSVTSPQASRPLLVTLRSVRTNAVPRDFSERDNAVTGEARRNGLSHVVLTETEVFSDYFRNLRFLGRVTLPWQPGEKRDPRVINAVRQRGPIRVRRLLDFLGLERARTDSLPLRQARAEVLASLCRAIRIRSLHADLSVPLDLETVISAWPLGHRVHWSPFSDWTKGAPVVA